MDFLETHVVELAESNYVENTENYSTIVYDATRDTPSNLTKVDLQMIEYLLTTNSNLTAKDLATTYNSYNDHRRINIIIDEKIMPLVEKNIFVRKNDTKGFIDGVRHNFNIGINK